jgi:hypothetical protein
VLSSKEVGSNVTKERNEGKLAQKLTRLGLVDFIKSDEASLAFKRQGSKESG